MKKTLLICVASLVAASAAKADFDGWLSGYDDTAIVSDFWSPAGHAWTNADQPMYARENILLANGDRQRILDEQAQIKTDVGFSHFDLHMLGFAFYTGYLGGGIFTLRPSDFVYTGGLVLLGIVYTGGAELNPILHLGETSELGKVKQRVNLGESIVVDGPNGTVEATHFRVFTWGIGSFDPPEEFTISFSLPSHVAFSHIALVQVPEPAAGILLAGAVAAGAVWVARRRHIRA